MPKNNEMEITVNNSSLDFTSAHETGNQETTATITQSGVCPPLTEELKERFVTYFKGRYPLTTRIILRRRHACPYARVKYRGESPRRTFRVWARTYEMLVLKTEYTYSVVRGLPPATNR